MKRKLTSMLLMATLVLGAPMSSQSGIPEPEPETMTLCYYGVQLTVTPKIAKRYFKLGATEGPCGGVQGQPGEEGPTGPPV